ncbi:carboxylesterase/lipase family protein [Sphingopyxis sp. JAI108]|uniref:carboxylesterase/lipase family protein n=1 Tax=Sphingopyxis sp. JAI108 TaxID=2723060 RepID=UPI0015CE5AD2|nr:carboxylesterase/lipase family protein [Sphingopyxis sp. JAI108]NYF30633.1 para-nitrobenzyl esterase [Sphingopyxis sp. JAI108]
MRGMICAIVLACAAATLPAATAQTSVMTETGEVAGVKSAQTISFKGIPYAAAPVGPLRWKAPEPALRWAGVRDASHYGNACPQPARKEAWAQVGRQGEDCLFLNVWRPANPGKYPVMVFLHGGGFVSGSAGVPLYEGTGLAARGAVIVTLNYRLGRLGYFAHPALTHEDPEGRLGNYGVMDQVAALEWVKRNIAAFGGDPDNVTLFGESAGAGTVQILMGSPEAKGLFHKAVSQSGSGGTILAPIRGGAVNAEALGKKFTDDVGLENASADDLRAIPVAEIIKARAFPFIDGKVVTQSPGEPFYLGKQMGIPLIIGSNSNESSLGGMTEATARMLLGSAFPELHAGYIALSGKASEAAAIDLAEGLGFVLPSLALADRHAAAGNPTFAYFFDQVPVDQRANAAGTDHGGELEYLFGNKPAEHRWDAADIKVSKLMGDYWVRFARSGNPNGGGAVQWPAVTTPPTAYLHLDARPRAARLAPVEEKAKAAAMSAAVKAWTAPAAP